MILGQRLHDEYGNLTKKSESNNKVWFADVEQYIRVYTNVYYRGFKNTYTKL